MKVCFKCNIEKTLDNFYKHKMMADGHLNKCKECAKKDSMGILNKNREEVNRKRRISRAKKSGKYADYSREYRKEKSDQSKALQLVYRSIKNGTLLRPRNCSKCLVECKPQAHHESYDKKDWLKVMFLCRSCHRKIHIEIGKK